MKRSTLRILYVPNESGDFRQVGFRRPLSNLSEAGLVGDVSVFSLEWRIRNGGLAEEHRQDLIRRVDEFQPNLVLMQHLGATGLRDYHFRAMRESASFQLIYDERDPYSRFLHPLPRAARAAGRSSDVVFTSGAGQFTNNFKRIGSRDVRWAPWVFDSERHKYDPIDQSPQREYDIVMIANRNTPRLRGLPNWKDRIRFVDYMQDRFGDCFAVFGRGWSGPSAQGPVDFSRQDEVIRSAWVSANWDHFANEPSYFSNRLPISLSTGSIHATGYHPGYEDIFRGQSQKFVLFERSHKALGDRIERFLDETTIADRLMLGAKAREFAFGNFRQDNQLVQFLNFAGEVVRPESAIDIWDESSNTLTNV